MLRFFLVLALAGCAYADIYFLTGKVVMQDGSAPPGPVSIERICAGGKPQKQAVSDRKGRFVWRTLDDRIAANQANAEDVQNNLGESSWLNGARGDTNRCVLRASMPGYESNAINLADLGWTSNPELPPLTLYRKGEAPVFDFAAAFVPPGAQDAWTHAAAAMAAKNWPVADRNLRTVLRLAPKFATAWSALAVVAENRKDPAAERDAWQHAIAADPKDLAPRLALLRLEITQKEWPAAAAAGTALLHADTGRQHPEAYGYYAIAQFQLHDPAGALASAAEAIRLDPNHEYPHSEFIYGLLLEAKGDLPGAAQHLKRYLELEPKAPDADAVRRRIENLGKNGDSAEALGLGEPPMTAGGEADVPGGLRAFAAIARLPKVPAYADFFREYSRAVVHETSIFNGVPLPEYAETLQTYMATMEELRRLGETRGNRTVVTINPRNAGRILPLLGWRAVQEEGGGTIEPGDTAADALRQPIPAALGIDEIAMRTALEAGRSFEFSFPSEKAHLLGGAAWTALLKGVPPLPGGIADAFARDFRMDKAYLGLSSMSPQAAVALAQGVGLRSLVTLHADVLAQFGAAFDMSGGAAAVPGGPPAYAAWADLAGASPRDPPAFFRGILTRDRGTLAAFYSALAGADARHQRYFTANTARTRHFYEWYRDSGEVHLGLDRRVGNWRAGFFQNLPLDAAGGVRFPAGAAAWAAAGANPDDALETAQHLEALIPIAQIEERRKAPLDSASVGLLARNYAEWSSLFPYFEKLPGLGAAEFRALETFGTRAASLKIAARNTVLGEWHSLVELMALGSQAGSLEPARAAEAFREACTNLTGANSGAAALAILRQIAGSGSTLDEAVPAHLLRLSGARRVSFDRIEELQNVPPLRSADALAALSGLVYAALLSPDNLLAAADAELLRKHRFVKDTVEKHQPFFDSELVSAATPPGSYFFGGFTHFPPSTPNAPLPTLNPEAERPAEVLTASIAALASSAALSGPSSEPAPEAVFHASARLVEVYATVTDDRGRFVDDLPARSFTILENGRPTPAVAFESRSSGVSVALLFDTTGSMQKSLPALKNAAIKLIGELRPIDSVAVYGFAGSVTALEPFTTDKAAAERAVLRTHAAGATALYDALVRVNQDLMARGGKKVLVVFTDGADNLSVLTTAIAARRARSAGIPVYTIAQGDAVRDPALLKQLATLSKATGGVAFTISGPGEIRRVFEAVSRDLAHGYLLTFEPPAVQDRAWRTIEVTLQESGNRKVRAREGYYPE